LRHGAHGAPYPTFFWLESIQGLISTGEVDAREKLLEIHIRPHALES
jgi:hypothetical protein